MKRSLAGRRACLVAILLTVRAPAPGLSARELGPADTRPVAAATKVLRFPQDQCLGVLQTEDRVPRSECFQHNFDPSLPWAMDSHLLDLDTCWESVGIARGDVAVPADREIALRILLKARPSELIFPNLRDRRFTDPEDLAGLSGLEPNDLGMLFVSSLAERTYADERVIKPLSRFTGLKMLRLGRTGVTDKGMEYLRSLRSLRSLELMEAGVSDTGLAVLKDLPSLEYVDLYTRTGDAGLKYLAQLPNLRWLRIRMGYIGGPGLAELAHGPHLERLSLWGSGWGLTDQHIGYLEGLTHLKSLTLWGTSDPPLTDASLASISKLAGLEELYFVRIATRFTSAGIAHLKSLKNLKNVDFGSMIDEASTRHLAGMPSLATVSGGVPLTTDSVKALASIRNLRSIGVILQDETAPGIVPSLLALTSLEELNFTGSRAGVWLSDDNLVGLESLDRLRRLHLWGDEVTDRSMARVSRLKGLESLTLWADVSKHGLNQLSGLTHLRSFATMPPPGRTREMDEIRLKLSTLTELRMLSLRGQALRNEDVASLAGLHHLDWLVLEGTFTEGALWHLKDLAELKVLMISGVSCSTGEGLAQLGELKRLGDLTIEGRITDAALSRLPALPSLWSLRLVTEDPIRPETIALLKRTLPVIEYIHIDKPLQANPPLIQSSPPQRGRTPANPPRVNRTTPRAPQRRR